MTEEAISSMVTILSVLVGGLIAFFTSWYFARRSEKDRQLSTAYSVMFKVQKYTNDLLQLDRHIREARKAANQHGVEGPPWAAYSDIIGFMGSEENVTSEELALIAKTKDPELVMAVRELESAHAISLSAIEKIQNLRSELGKSDLIQKVDGQVVSFEATPEQYAKIAPLIINLDSLANSTFEALPRMLEQAVKTANALGGHLKKHYKFKHFIQMTIAEPDEGAQQPPS